MHLLWMLLFNKPKPCAKVKKDWQMTIEIVKYDKEDGLHSKNWILWKGTKKQEPFLCPINSSLLSYYRHLHPMMKEAVFYWWQTPPYASPNQTSERRESWKTRVLRRSQAVGKGGESIIQDYAHSKQYRLLTPKLPHNHFTIPSSMQPCHHRILRPRLRCLRIRSVAVALMSRIKIQWCWKTLSALSAADTTHL